MSGCGSTRCGCAKSSPRAAPSRTRSGTSSSCWRRIPPSACATNSRSRSGEIAPTGQRPGPHGTSLWQNPDNLWLQAAVLSSLADGAGDLFVTLAGDAPVARRRRRAGLAAPAGDHDRSQGPAGGSGSGAGRSWTRLRSIRSRRSRCFTLLGDGLHRARSSLALMDPQTRLQPILRPGPERGLRTTRRPEPLRVGGIRSAGRQPLHRSPISAIGSCSSWAPASPRRSSPRRSPRWAAITIPESPRP